MTYDKKKWIESQNDLAKDTLKNQIEFLSTGDNLVNSIAQIEFLKDPNDDRPCWNWTLRNRLLMTNRGSFDSRNENVWKNLGRHPIDWSKKIIILRPNLMHLHKVDKGLIVKSGRTFKCRTCNHEFQNLSLGIADKTILVIPKGFMPQTVYDVSNTYGKELENTYTPKKLPALFGLAEVLGIKVQYLSDPTMKNNSHGFVMGNNNAMVLQVDNPKVFYHELAHKIDQKINLDGKLKGGQDPKQEIVAELTASVLEKMYEEENTGKFSFEYIAMYAEKQKKTVDQSISQILPRVEKILKWVMEESEKLNVQNGMIAQ